MKNKGKVPFEEILDLKMRKISFEFHGFTAYKISPPMISIPGYLRGLNHGFDVYISGNFNREIRMVACYAKVTDVEYTMIKIYELDNNNKEKTAEAAMALRYFERHYLQKQNRLKIVQKD